MTEPLFSVVIPTYRRDTSLKRLLDQLKRQTLADLELVVVDQNPEGFLRDRIGAALSGTVHLAQTEPNASSARNAGFARSRGRYVLFVDNDLIPQEDLCRQALDTLQRHPDVGCLCPLVVTAAGRGAALSSVRRSRQDVHPGAPSLWRVPETISAAIFFERDVFLRTGGFDELLFRFARTAEDQELFRRMRARGLPVWLDTDLSLFHDEGVPGGCELRTDDYWKTRKRCIQSWAFRARIHNRRPGALDARDLLGLTRSAFLNSDLRRNPPAATLKNVALLRAVLTESARVLLPRLAHYSGIRTVDHLAEQLAGFGR